MVFARLNAFATTLKNMLFIGSVIVGTMTGSITLFVKFVYPAMITQIASDLNIVTKADIAALSDRIDVLTGEDGIFVMDEQASFVHEPVDGQGKVKVTLVARRTERGIDCVFVGGRPLYVDQTDIPYPGEPLQVIRQISTEGSKLLLELSPPHWMVQDGRVGVYLSLEYSCPFGPNGTMMAAFDATKTIYFKLERKF